MLAPALPRARLAASPRRRPPAAHVGVLILAAVLAMATPAVADVRAVAPPVAVPSPLPMSGSGTTSGLRTKIIATLLAPALRNRHTARAGRVFTSGLAARTGGIALAAAGLVTAASPVVGVGDGRIHDSTAGALLTLGGATLFAAGTFYELAVTRNPERYHHLQHVKLAPMMVGTVQPSTVGLGFDGRF